MTDLNTLRDAVKAAKDELDSYRATLLSTDPNSLSWEEMAWRMSQVAERAEAYGKAEADAIRGLEQALAEREAAVYETLSASLKDAYEQFMSEVYENDEYDKGYRGGMTHARAVLKTTWQSFVAASQPALDAAPTETPDAEGN